MISKPAENASDSSLASVRLSTARRIHTLCRRFEADWRRAGQVEVDAATQPGESHDATPRPQLKSYLVGFSEPERSALLAELLALELELRSSLCGEQPSEAEYHELFPADGNLIAAVFRQWREESDSQQRTLNARRPAGLPSLPQVDGYEILGVLGRGGMGVVYKARQLRLKRLVALKMILAGPYASDEHLTRFRAEAETVARLQHPNIVQIFDIGGQDRQPFLTFELIEGVSLAEFAQHEPLPPRSAAELVEVLALAMQYAHQQGIVHRDLKPANVLLGGGNVSEHGSTLVSQSAQDETGFSITTPSIPENSPLVSSSSSSSRSLYSSGTSRRGSSTDGSASSGLHTLSTGFVPKITDFGLAKDLYAGAENTLTGAILGTANYMSPEQAAGRARDIGPASDIYSLGAILYMLLTGRAPFQGTSPIETIHLVIENEPIAPTQFQPRLPKDLETICLKCLRKQPVQRYATAGDLADDLRRFQQNEPIVARPVGRIERAVKWARRRPAIATLLLVAALCVAGIVWKYLDAEQQRAVAQERREFAEAQQSIAKRNEQEALLEAAKAKKSRDFLLNVLKLSDPEKPGEIVTARQILDVAQTQIPVEFAEQPELRSELLAAIGGIYDEIESRPPVAMILAVQGRVQLQAVKKKKRQPVPQTLLYAHDRLSLAEDARVQLVFLSDLHTELLEGVIKVTVRLKGSQPPEAVRDRNDDSLMTFVRLPKGTFYMGWDGQRKGEKTEITEDFEIGAYLVTQRQWQVVMEVNPSYRSRFGNGRHLIMGQFEEELNLFPVEMVSWHDVQNFLIKLNDRERGSGWLYRLPTEAEWEYSCRGGATSEEECSYYFYFDQSTNELSSNQANYNGDAFGQGLKGVRMGRPTRVGAYSPNKLGLCDMHGNVFQWCSNRDESKDIGVLRGGSFRHDGSHCIAAYRHFSAASLRYDHHGFRLVRVRVE